MGTAFAKAGRLERKGHVLAEAVRAEMQRQRRPYLRGALRATLEWGVCWELVGWGLRLKPGWSAAF